MANQSPHKDDKRCLQNALARPARLVVRVALLGALGAGLVVPCSGAEALDPRPVAVCGTTSSPPKIDGKLDDPAWREAAFLAPFVRVAIHDEPSQAVTCRVVRDDQRLYAGFECHEDDISALSTEVEVRDHPRAWADDCVQLFIAPGDPRRVYFHIIVTAANVVFDERILEGGEGRETAWDARIISATRREEDRWTCELSFHLSDISQGQPMEGSWRFNAVRAEQPHNEWSSWSPLNANFFEYENLGRLILASEPVVTGLDLPKPFLGRNEFRFSVGAAQSAYVTELQILRGDMIYPKVCVRVASQSSASFSYLLQNEGSAAVRLIVRPERGDELLYASPPVVFSVPPVRSLAQETDTRLTAAAAVASKAKDKGMAKQLAAEIGKLKAEARVISQAADRLGAAGAIRRSRWLTLHERARALAPRARITELKGYLAGLGVEKIPSFALGTETSLRKLAPEDCEYSISRELRLKCARRERESAQVVVASLGDRVEDVRVEWTGLRGPEDARIGHDEIEVSRVGYVTTRPPMYQVERVGRWPDPLMPLEPFAVPANEIQPLWVTVSVPAEAQPGKYVGELTVSTPADPPQRIKLVVEVWDIELPLRGRFRTGFGNVFRGDVCQWYGFRGDPPEEFRRKFYETLLKNRVNPAGLYVRELWPLREDFDWCYERGLNALSLGNLGVADARRLQSLAEAADWLRQRRLLDMAYAYGFSHLSAEDMPRAREGFSKVRRLIPGLRRACPIPPTKSLWGYVSIWGALSSEYDHLTAQKRRRLGEEVWWYVCCGPRHPYGNFFIDYPAADARTLFWAAYKYHITGFFYYEVAMWSSNLLAHQTMDPSIVIHEDQAALAALREGRRWPDVPWNTFTFSRYNGDGQLIYPGRNETPLPSLRLEVIRDGIEDYELLALLAHAVRELKGLDQDAEFEFLVDESMRLVAVDDRVVRDLTHFTRDPQVIETQRQRVAHQIVRVQRTIRQLETEAEE